MDVSNQWAVECESLGRVYSSRSLIGGRRETIALDDLSFQIPQGVVFGLLGPNGAGKTTTVRILSTLLTPTSGSARVSGYDVVRQASEVRRNIRLVSGGERGFCGDLIPVDRIYYFGALNHINPGEANRCAQQLLEQVGLPTRAKLWWSSTPVE